MIVSSINYNECPDNCQLCGCKDDDLRPYGSTDALWICFPCGMRNEKQTAKNFQNILDGNKTDGIKIN